MELKEASHLRGKHQYSDQRSSQIRALCEASTASATKREENRMAGLSAEKKQLTEAGRSLMKREQNRSLRNTSTDSKEATVVILKNYANAPLRRERASPLHETRREAGRNTFCDKKRDARQSRNPQKNLR